MWLMGLFFNQSFLYCYHLQGKDVDPTIRKILEMYNQNTVDVEDYIWETMELQECQEVTPHFINKYSANV